MFGYYSGSTAVQYQVGLVLSSENFIADGARPLRSYPMWLNPTRNVHTGSSDAQPIGLWTTSSQIRLLGAAYSASVCVFFTLNRAAPAN